MDSVARKNLINELVVILFKNEFSFFFFFLLSAEVCLINVYRASIIINNSRCFG